MRVLIAPDSFKGSISNSRCAAAIAEGWLSIRPTDSLLLLPMADGGEGTLETIAQSVVGAERIPTNAVQGAHWLLLPDGTAIVELASICGIELMEELDPMYASTFELGMVLSVVAQDVRVKKLVITVGGSASTDGGAGALVALGARFLDKHGNSIGLGGAGLRELEQIDLTTLVPAPAGGVTCLVDVNNPLLGELGSAQVFAPQKGADEFQVHELERGLRKLQEASGLADFPGAGAAGGTPFGLSLAWKINLESGALEVARLIGFTDAIKKVDLVITGEGRFDSQSLSGKVVGVISDLALAAQKEVLYCVGSSESPLGSKGISLIELAPTLNEAMENPYTWLVQAGRELALRIQN